jgi:hypothetical protein
VNLSLSIIAFAFRVKELRDSIPSFFSMVQSMRFSVVQENHRISERALPFHQTVLPSNLGQPDSNQAKKADLVFREWNLL